MKEELTEEQLDKEIKELDLNYVVWAAYKHNRRTGAITFEGMKKEIAKWEKR